MYKNYLKMAYRNLMRHKVFSLINVSGLALGMTCSILIMLWVRDEVSTDRFHENIDDLYRVMEVQSYPGADDLTVEATPGPLAEALERDMPEVVHAVRTTTWDWKQLFAYEDKVLKVNGRYTDPAFLEAFSFPLLHGDAALALTQPNSVVISEKVARQFFNSPEEAMGKLFKVNNTKSYKVTGVLKDVPQNSTMQFDYVMPVEDWINSPGSEWLKDWGNNALRTFLQLQPGTDVAVFNAKIKSLVKDYHKGSNTDLFVQPVSEMYLHDEFEGDKASGGNIERVRLFGVVAVFILLIACINFMNLSTARSAKRAKEVGVRKSIGASRPALISQFMVESVLVAFFALFLSLNLTGLLLPLFNELTGKAITLNLSDPLLLILLLGVALFTGLVSGSYPALFLSSFEPVVVLKGTARLSRRVTMFRKGLVVFQFVLSALLIISTLVVYTQLHHIQTKDIGMQRDNVVLLPLEGELHSKYKVLKDELLKVNGIANVTAANQSPLMVGNSTGSISWEGKAPNADILFSILKTDYDFVETMGMQLKEGRSFSRNFGAEEYKVLLNEEAATLMQLKEPVGSWIESGGVRGTIIGVVKNFHANSMHKPVSPLVMMLGQSDANTIFVRVKAGQTASALASIEQALKKHNPAYPFEYHFLDEDFEKMYKAEAVMGQLTKYFAFIAIFISCLGLFGLALFTAEQRTKEIGIRKVLGASVASIVYMLSKDFLKLVLIANVVALPLGWYMMNGWLNNYADRTQLNWWVFALALVATMVIALVTLSFHAIRTALATPVTSLRTE